MWKKSIPFLEAIFYSFSYSRCHLINPFSTHGQRCRKKNEKELPKDPYVWTVTIFSFILLPEREMVGPLQRSFFPEAVDLSGAQR